MFLVWDNELDLALDKNTSLIVTTNLRGYVWRPHIFYTSAD